MLAATLPAVSEPDDDVHDAASAEARAWLRNRNAAPRSAPWPGAHALAALVDRGLIDHGELVLAPDASLLWAALVAVPPHACPGACHAPLLAATYRTAFRFGMPLIGGPLPRSSCDFRLTPLGVDAPARKRRGDFRPRGTFDGRGRPRLFRLYNGMWAALLDAGRRRRRAGGASDRGARTLPEGGPAQDLRPRAWAPRALLAFAEVDLPAVRRLAFRPGPDGRPLAPAVLAAFVVNCRTGLAAPSPYTGLYLGVDRVEPAGPGAVAVHRVATAAGAREFRLPVEAVAAVAVGVSVRVGETVARFGPRGPLPRGRLAWEHLAAELGAGAGVAAACWYDLQAIRLEGRPGLAFLPSALAAPAARDLSRPAHLVWDVTPAEPLFDPDVEAFRFPPMPARRWDDWRGTLPGEVAYDLTPRDARLGPRDGR